MTDGTAVHPTVATLKAHFNAGEALEIDGTLIALDDNTEISQQADGRLVITGKFQVATDKELTIDLSEAIPTPNSIPVDVPPVDTTAAPVEATPVADTPVDLSGTVLDNQGQPVEG